MFSRTSTEGRVLAMYDVFFQDGPREAYPQLVDIVAKEAAAWRAAKIAGGFGELLAAAATPPDTLDRDLAVLRVQNSLDDLKIYDRTVAALREAGLSEASLTKIDDDLRVVTGGEALGQPQRRG